VFPEIHRVYTASLLAPKGHRKLVEGAVLHVDEVVDVAHIVDEMGVAVGDEVEALEVGELLQYLVLGDAEVNFETVGPEVRRHETQLAHERGGALVDVRRHEEAADAVHLVVDAVDVDIDGVQQVVLLLADNLVVLVHDELVAEAVDIVLDLGQMRVEEELEGVELGVVAEVAEAVRLLLAGHLHAAEDEEALLLADALGDLHLPRGVVVADGYHVQPAGQGTLDDGRGRHLEVAARREHRVDVQVGFERSNRHRQRYIFFPSANFANYANGLINNSPNPHNSPTDSLAVQQLVDFADGFVGLHVGAEEGDALLVALLDGVFTSSEALDEDDAGQLLEGSNGHDILVGLEGHPHVAHLGIAHDVAEEVADIASVDVAVETFLATQHFEVQFFNKFSYFHISVCF